MTFFENTIHAVLMALRDMIISNMICLFDNVLDAEHATSCSL
jgi:hypothetical protein